MESELRTIVYIECAAEHREMFMLNGRCLTMDVPPPRRDASANLAPIRLYGRSQSIGQCVSASCRLASMASRINVYSQTVISVFVIGYVSN